MGDEISELCYLKNTETKLSQMTNLREKKYNLSMLDVGPDGWLRNFISLLGSTCIFSQKMGGVITN